MTDDLIERLEMKASVMEMGEKIAWGSDTALMRDAAARIRELEADLRLRTLERDHANDCADAAIGQIRELEAALERIAYMKPHHAGQTANEYHMQQIAKEALAGQGGET